MIAVFAITAAGIAFMAFAAAMMAEDIADRRRDREFLRSLAVEHRHLDAYYEYLAHKSREAGQAETNHAGKSRQRRAA